MSLLEKTKEELVELLSVSEYINDEFLVIMYNTAKLFNIDIKDPMSESITVREFITDFKNKMNNTSEEYISIKNNSNQI